MHWLDYRYSFLIVGANLWWTKQYAWKKTGVTAEILNEQAKDIPTHCHAHFLSLSVKDTRKNVESLNNPKRERMLGKIKDNIDADIDEGILEDKACTP